MADDLRARTEKGTDESLADRLDSWKEIATFLGRGIRTVQRWEREEGMPVHRLAHEKRGSVYARRAELSAWWESRRLTLAAPSVVVQPPTSPRLERITLTSAMTTWPGLSSDARLIAYVSDAGQDSTRAQIWIQQVGGEAIRLTNDDREYSHLSFSPDDTRIVFTAIDETGPGVYEVPALGGEPRLLQRGASRGQISPDGRWLACVPRDAMGIRVAARGGAGFRTIASELVDVTCLAWSPDSRALLVHARSDPSLEPDWWLVPLDGGAPANTGLVAKLFREAGLFTIPTGVAWIADSLLFSAAGTRRGVSLFRQRISASTFQPAGSPEQLTASSESAWLPSAAAGRVVFLSSRADSNLWSVGLDRTSGVAHGPLSRMSRGPGPLGYLSVTADFRTLAYFSFRLGQGEIFLRHLDTRVERTLSEGPSAERPSGERGYPAISPGGSQVAYGLRMPTGARPIFVVRLTDGTWRQLGEDCGGRPRQWVDERRLIIERFARLNSIAVLDTDSGHQQELLTSQERSVTNARLSPDGRWIAFDALRPVERAGVFIAPFGDRPIADEEWLVVDRAASHPFWSADGGLLYYLPIATNPLMRSVVRARRFSSRSGQVSGESIAVYASTEMLMPAYLPGTAPIATPDQIMLVLGDFRGDIWMMDLS